MTTRLARFAVLAIALFFTVPSTSRAADGPSAVELELKRQLDELRKENEGLRKQIALLMEMNDVKQRLGSLEQKVDALAKPRVQTRIAGALPETGTIRLENRLGLPSTMILDGIAYRLNPYEVRDLVSQPAGPFNFEVLVDGFGSRGRGTRNLPAGGMHTIFAYQP